MKLFIQGCVFLLLFGSAYAGPQIVRDKTSKAVIRISPEPIRLDGKIPLDLDPALELVDVIDPPAQPAFNPATQKVVPVSSEQAGAAGFPIRLINDWQVVSLTQAELDAKAALTLSEQERQQAKAIVADLKNGTGTTVERLQRCEKALARIIPDIYK